MKITLSVLIALASLSVSGQNTNELYMPREYKKAYNNETRSYNGMPGKNYFQNKTIGYNSFGELQKAFLVKQRA